MARNRTSNEIILSLIDFFRIAQPLLDTKPGTVTRDLIIDGPATQISKLYDELNRVSNLQSLRLAIGSDLDKLAQNLGAVRQKGSKATVPALLTFNSLDSDISINKGDQVTAKNGSTFLVLNSIVISSVFTTTYKAIATKYRSDLDFVGITDQYAIEVLVEASAPGSQGNVSKYSLNSTNISGINNVTNVSPAGGGTGTETDAAFRSRILSVFSGANTGTALGYRNAALSDPSVIDVIVIEPGDSLMTRDGTQVKISSTGERTIISEGSGGKVDLITFGNRLQQVTDSFVYHDLSNTNDPTNSNNDFVLGQISDDIGKTVSRKRIDNLASNILPNQPVNNIVQVTGSISGPNFIEKSVDSFGRVSGNYELIRDDQAFGGSPWGFDRLHWISNRISDFIEDKTKTVFNGQDPLSFPDVLEIKKIQENKTVVNENSKVNAADRTSIQLSHKPITNVTRVFNVNTGERYVIANQNPDGTGSINTTGRILISGKSLPAVSDILQVDYTWIFSYDPFFDFDNRLTTRNPRTVQDSVDWGFSNIIKREKAVLTATGSYLNASVLHPISTVLSVNVFSAQDTVVSLSSGRLSIIVDNTINNVISIIRQSDGAELWNTTNLDGTFSGKTIFLPTDSVAELTDLISVVYNTIDVFNAETQGSFNNNTITIVPSEIATAGTIVECTYIANINTLLPSTLLSALPAIRYSNYFKINGNQILGFQPYTNIYNYNGAVYSNLRQAPSNLSLTITGTISPGVLTVSGTTLSAVVDSVFTVSNNSLKQDLSIAIKKFLGLSSKDTIPNNIKIAKVVKIEKVTTTSSLDVLSIDQVYDLKGYAILDNSFVKEDSVSNSTLKASEILLPTTTTNVSNTPTVGQKLRVTFYLATFSDSENINFTKSGILFTDKKFAIIDTIAVSSGFTSGSSSSATLSVNALTQPNTRTRYRTTYDYLAPKMNERITIDFNYQKIITDTTLAVEKVRSINADVLVKSASPILVDVILNIVVNEEFKKDPSTVIQNVRDAVTNSLNAKELGTTVDSSDLINTSYGINGVDRVRVVFFNKTNYSGSVLSITAQKNEFIVANNVNIIAESR